MNADDFMKNLRSKFRIQILCICCPQGNAEIGNESDTEDTVTPKEPLLKVDQ